MNMHYTPVVFLGLWSLDIGGFGFDVNPRRTGGLFIAPSRVFDISPKTVFRTVRSPNFQ